MALRSLAELGALPFPARHEVV